MKKIFLSEPIIGEDEKQALCDVIDSGWLSQGERVAEFAQRFAELHGHADGVAVNSCTAGLHLGLVALGIGPGDEVLVPSLSFVATTTCVIYAGATPVFVDIRSTNEPHMSIEDARKKLTPQTRAVVVMHYGGYLADIAAWREFADEHGLALVEDAAHAPKLPGVAVHSDVTAFSFFPNKNMTTAEGGMVLASKSEVLDDIRTLRSHGMTTTTLDRRKGHAHTYDVVTLGFNYRLDELRAAIGLCQLKRLEEWNEARKERSLIYRRMLSEKTPEVIVPFDGKWETVAHLLPVLLPENADRKRIMDTMREGGVFTSVHYPATHEFSHYTRCHPCDPLPKTEAFTRRELTLPLHPGLTEDDIAYVVDELRSALG